MRWPKLLTIGLFNVCFAFAACSDGKTGETTPVGGAAGSTAASGGSGGSGRGTLVGLDGGPNATVGEDGFSAACEESTNAPPNNSGRLSVNIQLLLGNNPLVFGEKNAMADGDSYLPSNTRLFLSQIALMKQGVRTPVTLLNADNQPARYGVHLVNAGDIASLKFGIQAVPGTYDGLSFIVGISEACNTSSSPLKAPLDSASQMKWPHSAGYLFVLLGGTFEGSNSAMLPKNVHMGSPFGPARFAPKISVPGPVVIAENSTAIDLKISIDKLLKAAAMPTDLSDVSLLPGEEIVAGERLRRHLKEVEAFSFSAAQDP